MKKLIYLFLLVSSYVSKAQLNNEALKNTKPNHYYFNKKNVVHLEQLAYLRNNEYFELIHPGATFFGTQIKTTVDIKTRSRDNRFNLQLGGFLQQDFGGKNGGLKLLPLITTSFTDSHTLIQFGAINSHVNHGMHDAMLSYENALTNAIEYGALYKRTNSKHKLETWLEWRSAMDIKTQEQEKIIWGISSALNYSKANMLLSFPFQNTIYHAGGQGLASHVVTRINSMLGAEINLKKSWKIGQLIFTGIDNSVNKSQAFSQGYAFYSYISFAHKNHLLHSGFWQGHQYVSTLGNGIFTNVNILYPYANMQNRRLIAMRYNYSKPINEYYQFDFRFEPLYNLENKDISHSASLFFKAFWN